MGLIALIGTASIMTGHVLHLAQHGIEQWISIKTTKLRGFMIKRFYSLSLVALFVSLMVGCGSNDTTNQGTANTQSNDQNTQTEVSQKANGGTDSLDLKQRTAIPFKVRQATRDTLPLLGIMVNLERNLNVVQAGIWREDYQAINKAATAMVNHAKIPKREIQKIRSILGEEGLKDFVAADKYWHNKAKELAQAANKRKMEQIVNRTMELTQRCASCHTKFRAPLRNSSKWLNR